jgi:hypothetical protein
MYLVLLDLFPVGWLVEASAVVLGGLKLLAPVFAPLLAAAVPAPEGEDFAALADEPAALAELPLEAAADEPLEADVELAPLGVVVPDVELPPCCHAGAVLFSCNYFCWIHFNDT